MSEYTAQCMTDPNTHSLHVSTYTGHIKRSQPTAVITAESKSTGGVVCIHLSREQCLEIIAVLGEAAVQP